MSLFQQRVYWANYCLINGPVFSDIITLSNNWNIVVVLTVCDYQICLRFQKLDRTILCLRQSCGIEKQNGPQGSMADRSPTGDTDIHKVEQFHSKYCTRVAQCLYFRCIHLLSKIMQLGWGPTMHRGLRYAVFPAQTWMDWRHQCPVTVQCPLILDASASEIIYQSHHWELGESCFVFKLWF